MLNMSTIKSEIKIQHRPNIFFPCVESPLNVPTDLSVVLVKTTGFTVKYKQVPESDLPTKYDIYIFDISTEKGFTKRVNHARLDSRPVTVKIEGLTGDTEYKVRMRAVNSVGDGKWTEEIKVKTGKPI